MRRETHVVQTFWGEWAIVYYLGNEFPVPCGVYRYRWLAHLVKWWVESVHGNYVDY
jgi:hypothetical protein